MAKLKEMYKGQVNSPETSITNNISETDTEIYVLDGSLLPEPPNLLVLGGGLPNAETVKLVSKEIDKLTVIRGFQGSAKAWNSGTSISRNYTAYDHDAVVENIETLNGNKTDIRIIGETEEKQGDEKTIYFRLTD